MNDPTPEPNASALTQRAGDRAWNPPADPTAHAPGGDPWGDPAELKSQRGSSTIVFFAVFASLVLAVMIAVTSLSTVGRIGTLALVYLAGAGIRLFQVRSRVQDAPSHALARLGAVENRAQPNRVHALGCLGLPITLLGLAGLVTSGISPDPVERGAVVGAAWVALTVLMWMSTRHVVR
jgi:hypothetical protein